MGRPRPHGHGGPSSAPPPARPSPGGKAQGGKGATACVTPRQTCPRPDGFGRNLRSKTRWFTGFCNSHQVSHFATFFIDARAEISVAESHFCVSERGGAPSHPLPGSGARSFVSFPWRVLRRCLLFVAGGRDATRKAATARPPRREGAGHHGGPPPPGVGFYLLVRGSLCSCGARQ